MTLSAAVIGTGFIGPVHVEGLKRAGVAVRGILGSTREKSIAAAARLNVQWAYASIEELLADRQVDVVHIATPNRFHFEQAKASLVAGKHVICEKPLAMHSRESAELVRVAARSQRAAAVAYNTRFYPLCHEAAARVRQGQIGELLHVQGSYVQDWLLQATDYNWRVAGAEGGELRAVADIGTHWLDLIQFITGQRVRAVCADLRTVHPVRMRPRGGAETFAGARAAEAEPIEVATEDCGTVILRFENGANGCLWVSQTTAGRKNCLRYEIGGSKRSLAWNSESPNDLWIGQRDGPNEWLPRDPALLSEPAAKIASYPGGHAEGYPDTFKQLFRVFYRFIAEGGYVAKGENGAEGKFTSPAPFPTFADGHREILCCEAVLQSHREQRWVAIDEKGS